MASLEQLVTDLSGLTVIEAAELSKMLEERWGVSAAAPVAAAAAPAAAAAAPALEKTEFTVILTDAGRRALEVAAPKHVASVRAHFIDLLTADQIDTLDAIAQTVIEEAEVLIDGQLHRVEPFLAEMDWLSDGSRLISRCLAC